MTEPTDAERAQFETWAISEFISVNRSLDGTDGYFDGDSQIAWQAWQAARRTTAPVGVEPARIDCGEAGCAEGCCGNAKCLPSAAPAQQPRRYTPPAQERIDALELEVRQLTEQLAELRDIGATKEYAELRATDHPDFVGGAAKKGGAT